MNFLTISREALATMSPEKAQLMQYAKPPITRSTKDISPFSLNRKGVVLVGSSKDVIQTDKEQTTTVFKFKKNSAENIKTCYDGFENIFNALRNHVKQPDVEYPPE